MKARTETRGRAGDIFSAFRKISEIIEIPESGLDFPVQTYIQKSKIKVIEHAGWQQVSKAYKPAFSKSRNSWQF